ncbi:MAG: CopG family ribbon-helix-helix protein [Candidatus Acidiferrum sp.]
MADSTTVTIRVTKSLKTKLAKLASSTDRSSSWLAARALEVYVDDQTWQIEAIRKGKKDFEAGRTVPHEKVDRWLRSWGTKHEEPPPTCE